MDALLNFSQPLDLNLLEQVVGAVYQGTSKETVCSWQPVQPRGSSCHCHRMVSRAADAEIAMASTRRTGARKCSAAAAALALTATRC